MKGVFFVPFPCNSKTSGSSDLSCPCASERFLFTLYDAILNLLALPLPVVEARLGLNDGEFSRLVFVDPEVESAEDSSLFFAWKAMTTAAESAMPDAR